MITFKENELNYFDLKKFQEKNDIFLGITEDWFNWIYKENPVGNAHFYCAYDEDCLIGTEIHIPIILKTQEKNILSALSVNSLIDKSYRGKGIWRGLLNYSEKQAKNKDIILIWGTPNNKSLPILLSKENWKIIAEMRYIICYLKSTPQKIIPIRLTQKLIAFFSNINFRKDFKMYFFNEINEISFEERIHDYISILKSKEYVNWRYLKIPEQGYSLIEITEKKNKNVVAIICYFIQNNVFYLFDIINVMGFCEKIMPQLLKTIARKKKCRSVQLCINKNNPFIWNYFYSFYFINGENYVAGKILNENYASLFENNFWHYCIGDEEIKFVKPFLYN